VYFVLRGSGVIYAKRGEELASLMHQDGAISGEAREGDTFLLVSHGFSQVLSHDELTTLFDHLPPKDIAEKLTLLLHEKKGGEGSVALVYRVTGLEDSGLTEMPEETRAEEETEEKPQVTVRKNPIIPLRMRIAVFRRYLSSLRREPKKMTAIIAIGLISLFLVKGRERLAKAKELLDPYINIISPRSPEGYQLSLLYTEITDNLTQAMQVVDVPLSVFYDMSLIKKDAAAASVGLEGTTIVIGDRVTETIYEIDINSKKAQIIGGGDILKGLLSVTLHGDKYYALTGEGIIQFRSTDKKSTSIIKRDDSWGTITSFVSFAGNLYLLDTTKSRIWKYVATEDAAPAGGQGFSDIREYLNPDVLPDLSQTTNMAIDGSVWLGTANGKILRFTQGKENTFVPKGVDPALGTRLVVYTSDEVKNIYVLDSQNSRVVVLDKEGMYLAQYRWGGAVSPSDIVVSEEEKKILLLADGKIYSVDLK
jgi:DNA-binding beta-propeller fold protein YncE